MTTSKVPSLRRKNLRLQRLARTWRQLAVNHREADTMQEISWAEALEACSDELLFALRHEAPRE